MNRVKELRKEHKITQEKLAASLGISRSAVAMYETGKCDLSNEILIACASFFEKSAQYRSTKRNSRGTSPARNYGVPIA